MRISSLIWNGKGLAHIRSLISLSEFRAAKSSSPSTSLRSVWSLLRRYCAQVIHCIQIRMLLALTPIGVLRLNPIDLHQWKLLCEFTTMFQKAHGSQLTHLVPRQILRLLFPCAPSFCHPPKDGRTSDRSSPADLHIDKAAHPR